MVPGLVVEPGWRHRRLPRSDEVAHPRIGRRARRVSSSSMALTGSTSTNTLGRSCSMIAVAPASTSCSRLSTSTLTTPTRRRRPTDGDVLVQGRDLNRHRASPSRPDGSPDSTTRWSRRSRAGRPGMCSRADARVRVRSPARTLGQRSAPPLSTEVRTEQLDDGWIRLEGVHLDMGVDGRREQGVEADVGTDVENESAARSHKSREDIGYRPLEAEPAVRRQSRSRSGREPCDRARVSGRATLYGGVTETMSAPDTSRRLTARTDSLRSMWRPESSQPDDLRAGFELFLELQSERSSGGAAGHDVGPQLARRPTPGPARRGSICALVAVAERRTVDPRLERLPRHATG